MSRGVLTPGCRLLRGGEPRDRTPGREARLQHGVLLSGGEEVATGAEVIGDRTEETEGTGELLSVLGRCEALAHPFSSAGGPVGVLRPVVQPLVPAVLDPREHVAARGRGAGQVVGDHHAWLLSLSIQDTT